MPSVSRYRTGLPCLQMKSKISKSTSPDERAHARSLGQGAQTLVCPPGGGPVHAGSLAAPAAGSLHERQ